MLGTGQGHLVISHHKILEKEHWKIHSVLLQNTIAATCTSDSFWGKCGASFPYILIFFLIPGTYCFLVPVNTVSLWCKLWFHSLSAYLIRVSWTWEAGRFIWCPLLFSKTWIFHNRHGKMDICLVSFLLLYGNLFQFQELQYLITCLANIWFVLLLFSAILPFLLLLKTGLKVLGVSRQELTWIYTVSK